MATTALGIAPDSSGAGVTPLTHRQIIRAHWANTGIVSGLNVSGRGDLTYSFGAGMAVCSRGDADGYTEAYWAGGQTPAVSATGSQPRIDCIWIRANDPTQGDADNHVVIGVTQGNASPTPSVPGVPAGATRIGIRLMPAHATSTSGSTMYRSATYAVPSGASLGRLAIARSTADYPIPEDKDSAGKMVYHQLLRIDFAVPTKRLVTVEWKASATVPSGSGDDANKPMGSYFMQIRLDAKVINDTPTTNPTVVGPCDEIMATRYSAPYTVSYDAEVNAGAHQVAVWVAGNADGLTYPVTIHGIHQLRVSDSGVAD